MTNRYSIALPIGKVPVTTPSFRWSNVGREKLTKKNTKIPFAKLLTSENQKPGIDKTKADTLFASLSKQAPYQEQEITQPTKLANLQKG